MSDVIHNPAHYTVYPVQPIEISRHLGFCLGNVVKYVLRAPFKGRVEDLLKALKYLEWEMEAPTSITYMAYGQMSAAANRLSEYLISRNDAIAYAQAVFLERARDYAADVCHKEGKCLVNANGDVGMLRTSIETLAGILEPRKRLFVSFGQKYNLYDALMVFEGKTYSEVREYMQSAYDNHYAFVYSEEEALPQIGRFGLRLVEPGEALAERR